VNCRPTLPLIHGKPGQVTLMKRINADQCVRGMNELNRKKIELGVAVLS